MSDVAYNDNDRVVIERSTTGKRILFTILFVIIFELLKAVIGCIVLFDLTYSLITKRPPNARVTRFAHRVLRYGLDIGKYITFNKEELPFPFEDFQNETESPYNHPGATY